MALKTPISGKSVMHTVLLTMIKQYIKFKMTSFTHFKGRLGPQNFKMDDVTLTTPSLDCLLSICYDQPTSKIWKL